MIELALLVEGLAAPILGLGCLAVESKGPGMVWLATIAFLVEAIFHELTQLEQSIRLHVRCLVIVFEGLREIWLSNGLFYCTYACGAAPIYLLIDETFFVDAAKSEHRLRIRIALTLLVQPHCFLLTRVRSKIEKVGVCLNAHLIGQLLLRQHLSFLLF